VDANTLRSVITKFVAAPLARLRARRIWPIFVLVLTLILTWEWARVRVSGVHTSASSATGYVELSAASLPLQHATVAMEDGHFYHHRGFDWGAIRRAAEMDWDSGSIELGGSTITQQLAKNLFLTKDRTLWRKIEEVPLSFELERQLTKDQILELYLNNIDYGMGQRGVGAAVRYYFHKTPDKLTLAESAALVGMVPSPTQNGHEVQEGDVREGQLAALDRIRFFFPEIYSQEDIDYAKTIPLDHLMYPFKDAIDRRATDEVPAEWHGVSFYFFASPEMPEPIEHVATCLKPEIAGFLDTAVKKYKLVGIDHLGVYNDRPVRGSQTTLSAHAFGQAIDISGFRFADGTRVKVEDHDKPEILARLQPLEDLLKKHFDVVIDWRDDPKRHNTHFHAEVKGSRPGSSVVTRLVQ
jgi:hypothetical protein